MRGHATSPAPTAELSIPEILRQLPVTSGLRIRISEPLDACEQYRDVVEDLVHAGRWVYTIGVAYPPQLLAADQKLSDLLSSFAGDLRKAVAEINTFDRKRQESVAGLLVDSRLVHVKTALSDAATATENLRGLRQTMRSEVNRVSLRESALYQAAASALNRFVDEIEKAEEKRAGDAAFFETFLSPRPS